MKRPLFLIAAFVLVLGGAGVSYYLLHLDLKVAVGSGDDVCSAVFGTGCEGALLSEWASVLGLPLAGWGLVYFATLGMLIVLGWAMGDNFQYESAGGAFLLSVAGLVGSLVLSAEMVFGGTPLCPFCMVVHGVNLVLPFALAAAAGTMPWVWGPRLVGELRSAIATTGEARRTQQWKALGFFTVVLFAMVVHQRIDIQVKYKSANGSAMQLRETLAAYEAEPRHDIPVGPEDAVLGDADAPVKLVIFSDFECPACRNFALWSENLRQEFDSEVAFVFKHFPLSTQCNSLVKQDMHPLSCVAARASEAARRQGKFWEFHDTLFKVGLNTPQNIVGVAQQLQLDAERFSSEVNSEEVKQRVQTDVELGLKLGITSTPSVYWNGKRISRLSLPLARMLLGKQPVG